MDPLFGKLLEGMLTQSPGMAAAALLVWWILKTGREREAEMRDAAAAREAILLVASEKREDRLLQIQEKLANQYERVAVALGNQGVALNEGANTLAEVVHELAEMRREHNRIIGKED
jgi:hypothetical protein